MDRHGCGDERPKVISGGGSLTMGLWVLETWFWAFRKGTRTA